MVLRSNENKLMVPILMTESDVLRDFQLDHSSDITFQVQIYKALKERILAGRIHAGVRLPSSRRLAEMMSVSRNTINGALEQLKAEGYLQTKRGSGHFVADDLPDAYLNVSNQNSMSELSISTSQHNLSLSKFGNSLSRTSIKKKVSNGSFEAGVPDLKAFPIKKWSQLLHQHSQRASLMGYDSPQGYQPLRDVLADYLRSSRGVDCSADQIIITVGAQQACHIVSQVLLDEGDGAYVENPGYVGARKALMANGAVIEGIAVGEDGLDIDALPAKPKGKLIYVTPTHQYPMCGIMPLAHRLSLLNWAAKHGIWVVEDDYDSEYHYDYKPIAAMQGLGLKDQVIYIGSFSKVLLPGLRLGYLVVPDKLVDACVKAKNFMSGHSPILEQAATAEFIESGLFVRHLRQMRLIYEEKLQAMLSACHQDLRDYARPVHTGAGMHIVLVLHQSLINKGVRDTKVVEAMAMLNVYASPLSAYYLDTPEKHGLVLGFANTDLDKMNDGIMKIKHAISVCISGLS